MQGTDQSFACHIRRWVMYIFLAIVTVLGLLSRLLPSLARQCYPRPARTPNTSPTLLTRLSTILTKHISLPMLLRYRNKSSWGWIRLPNRLQGCLVGFYVAINVVFVCVDYETFDDNFCWRNDQYVSLCSALSLCLESQPTWL
jgi:hypothetical protein